MSSLTRKQRYQVYKEALELYLKQSYTPHTGMCYCINTAARILDMIVDSAYFCMAEEYPEIYKHKPFEYATYWFPTEDVKSRIKIFRQAKKETR